MKNSKTMTFYFIKTWLLIMIFSVLISGGLLYRLFEIQDETKSFWLIILSNLSFFFSLRFVFFLSISSVIIFLNNYESVRKNRFYSLATYCLIPFATLFCFMAGDLPMDESNFDILKSGWKFSAMLLLPHLIISFIAYLHFRKMLKSRKLQQD